MSRSIILKYPLQKGLQVVELPKGAKILKIAYQMGRIQMWALGQMDQPTENRTLFVVWTGEEFDTPPEGTVYLDSCVTDKYVDHVLEYPTLAGARPGLQFGYCTNTDRG